MQRRTALQLMLGTTVATALDPASTVAEVKDSPWRAAIGLNGFASSSQKYDKTFPIWEILDYASQAGFDGVELMRGWPMGDYPAANDKDRIRALKRMYDAYGLQIFSIQTGAGQAFAASPQIRQRWLKQMQDQIEFAKAVGCDCVGMWPGGRLEGQSIDQAIRHFGSSLREVARYADDVGIIAAFEIEPPFVFNTEEHLKRILEEANDSRVKTIYDPSHFDLFNNSSGQPHELLQRIGVENIGYVHFTDTDGTIRNGGTSKHLAAGDGHIDVAATFKTLMASGFQGWIMVDAWQIPDPYDASTKGLEAIRQAIAEG